jgi:hypothetical protein
MLPCMRLKCLILAGTLGLVPQIAKAQSPARKPAVFLRQIRIDSILLAFGVDSGRVREAVSRALREAGRLAPDTSGAVPSFDVDVAAPRTLGGMRDPTGFIRVEVGRNLVESGRSTRLQWERTVQRQPVPTWREFSRGTLADVLMAVNRYLLDRSGGA